MASAERQRQGAAAEEGGSDFASLLERQTATRPELLQMRMENETIMAECRAVPRDLGECKRKLAELLREFPEFAEEAIYRRPVGKDEETGRQKIAEGLSVRAAEALAEAYGYNRVRGDVTRVDLDNVKVDATFTDFATGRIWQDGRLVSQWMMRRDKTRYRIPDDRFVDTVVGAAKSKAIREVITRSVNPALKAWFENECRKITASLLTEEKMNEIVSGFSRFGIDLASLESLLGRPRAMGWTNNERLAAVGYFAALKNGETTVQLLLEAAGKKTEDAAPQQKSGGTLADRINARSGAATEPSAAATPTEQPNAAQWSQYVAMLGKAKTQEDARGLYDDWFGPNSTVKWTDDQAGEAGRLATARIAELPSRAAPARDESSAGSAGSKKKSSS